MSDCSTNAMKPKMPPKTCGTCDWFAPEPDRPCSGACMGSYDSDLCAYRLTNVHVREYRYPWCAGWRTKESNALEQRCQQLEQKYETVLKAMVECEEQRQQLEQVALDMLDDMAFPIEWVCDGEMRNRIENTIGFHKHRLEALGVSVDG